VLVFTIRIRTNGVWGYGSKNSRHASYIAVADHGYQMGWAAGVRVQSQSSDAWVRLKQTCSDVICPSVIIVVLIVILRFIIYMNM
jgi:hypothetical protein